MTESYEDIAKTSLKQLKKGSAEEMADVIFDTLFKNEKFPQLDLEKLTEIDEVGTEHQVNRNEKWIEFGYLGHTYRLDVTMKA